MDEETPESHWGTKPTQHTDAELSELTTEGKALFDSLKSNRFEKSLRLEQERIAWNE